MDRTSLIHKPGPSISSTGELGESVEQDSRAGVRDLYITQTAAGLDFEPPGLRVMLEKPLPGCGSSLKWGSGAGEGQAVVSER